MIQDLHSHTFYSYCGVDEPENVIKNAIEKGVDFAGINDHYHGIVLARPLVNYETEEERAWIHTEAIKRYLSHMRTLADKYKDKIKVWCGVEICTLRRYYTLLPDGVDVSMFDYALIETIDDENTVVDDLFGYAKRVGTKYVGIAHTDLSKYIKDKGYNRLEFFKKMAENNIFWELNVNFDSCHGYREHQYVKDFFNDEELIKDVKESGLKMSVGFDGHILFDYDINRVKNACEALEKLSIPMIKGEL